MSHRPRGSISAPAFLEVLLRRVGALLLLGALSVASAQTLEPPDVIDPPGRVGGISLLAGPVTLVDLATGSREEALLNWPVTGGWRIDTGRAGRAEVRIGSTALRLDDETTVDFVRLDDHFMQIAVLRGSVSLRLRNREVVNELELLTQRERIVFDDVGRYRIDVDRTAAVTAVTVFAGRVRIGSGNNTFVVAAGQRGEVTAPPMVRFQLSAAVADPFDNWVAARDARDDALSSATYVSRETTGVEVLEEYGDWRAVEDYGAVWFPRAVPATWAPYRYGRWVWVSPWGWTWVDEAPWGFAPLHYGRWVVVGSAWGWVPGVVVARPVYAPALVAWYSAPAAGIGAAVGWFPLGPREPYVPAHRHSPRYLRVVNVQNVPNVERVTIVQTPKYVHRHPDRSTWVPDERFGRPEPVNRGQRPPPSEWRQYIARPQPPANVPNTKRRQAIDVAAPALRTPAPSPIAEPRPVLQPPTLPQSGESRRRPEMPRAVEAPRAVEGPRAVEAPRAVETPRPRPGIGDAPQATEPPRTVVTPRTQPGSPPGGPQGRPERPADSQFERRASPRPPANSTPPAATPQPSVQPRTVERPAGPVVAPPQVQRPSVDAPAPAGRSDPGAAGRDNRRYAPRGPETSPASPAPQAAPPAAEAPRPAPPARAPQPARDEGGSQSEPRTARPRIEAAR